MQFITMRVLLKRIGAIWYLLKDKTVPLRKKALVVFGIIYLITPVDLIPAILFPFAALDDLVLWVYILWHLKDELDAYWIGEKTDDLSKKFRDKTMVEGVKFNVEKENTKEKETTEHDHE